MGSPIRPEPDNWLLDDLRRRTQGTPSRQLGPNPFDTFAPADASAVRTAPRQPTLSDYAHAGRQVLGGIAEFPGRLVTGAAGLLASPITTAPRDYELVTVGRGEVRTRPRTTAPVVAPAIERAIEHAGAVNEQRIGDLVGGVPTTVSDSSFRDLGRGIGDIAGFEAAVRFPGYLRRARGLPDVAPAPQGTLLREQIPERMVTREADGTAVMNSGRRYREPWAAPIVPQDVPPRAISTSEELLARPMRSEQMRAAAEGRDPRPFPSEWLRDRVAGQPDPGEWERTMRRMGVEPPPTPGGLLDALPTLDESGRLGVFHGSPHQFDKFSMEKIGTGEGAAAYGHGLYFAGDEAVAKYYREALSPRQEISSIKLGDRRVGTHNSFDYSPRLNDDMDNIRSSLFEDLLLNENEVGAAQKDGRFQQYVLDRLDRRIADLRNEDWPEGVAAAERLRKELARPGAVSVKGDFDPGGLYKVDIDADAEHFLDWDKPLSEQSPYVRERLRAARMLPEPQSLSHLSEDGRLRLSNGSVVEWTGADREHLLVTDRDGRRQRVLTRPVVERMLEADASGDGIGTGAEFYHSLGTPEEASQRLREAGIAGNRYLDAGSRGAGQGTHNYVVFDDSKLNITERGRAAPAMLGALGLLSGGALTAGLLADR